MDFQAIVLAAGKGSRMADITSKCPKALLPVGHRPVIWYTLKLLQNNGFKEAIIVLPSQHKSEIMAQIQANSDISLQLTEKVVQSSEEGQEIGTADVLRDIIKTFDIKKDLLVVSSDIVSDVSLDPLFALHYIRNSALTVLFTPILGGFLASPAPGPKTKRKVERDLVAIENDSKRLLFMASEADFEDEVVLKPRILKSCPRFKVYSNLQDAHVYIISNTVFDVWINDDEINSIKGDLVPYLCRKQFSATTATDSSKRGNVVSNIIEMSSSNEVGNFCKTAFACHGYIDSDSFCIRANNLAAYMYANRQISRLWIKIARRELASTVHSSIEIAEKSKVGNDNFVWKNVKVSQESLVRGCTIGVDCEIGSKTKLTNSIVMDKARIGDGCSLQNTIVCREAVVREGCQLNNCVVVDLVAPETKSNNEIITNEDRFMEI
ncbi:Eukaryotic translation initiation factor 2B, subunit 3 gamma, 58kDa [Chamberlinius hualienensis]